MRAIAKTYSPEISGWAARLHGRRMLCMKLHGSSGMVRRFAWTQTLIARFAHLPLQDLGRGRHLLLHGSWQWIRSSSSFAPQLQFALHTSVNANWNQHEPFHGTPPGLTMSGYGTMLHTVLARDHYRQSTLLNTVLFHQSTQRYRLQETRHSLATVIMRGSTARAAMSGLPTGAAAPTQKRADAREIPWSLATRVLRQNQRIEELVSGHPQTVLLRHAGPPLRERAFMDSPAAPQMRTSAASLEWPSLEPRPGVNISHITDEVVRQLDSRLVAARERFGKI